MLHEYEHLNYLEVFLRVYLEDFDEDAVEFTTNELFCTRNSRI